MSMVTYGPPGQNWFFRYKIYHLPFWIVYHYLWAAVTLGNPFKALDVFLSFPINYSFYIIFQALAVYFNLYVLMPGYLEKSRIALYIAYLLLTILGATLFIISGYYVSAYVSGKTMNELYGGGTDAACFFRFLGIALPSTVASMTLAMSIKLTKNWIQTRQRQQLLEREKLETELNFLKAQFNPHFLFNSINSVFFLIHKNPVMASASLAKFSDLLRYQLYECNDRQIPLGREIAYLENFIELEKLRQNDLTVQFAVGPTGTDQLGIAPFILMTFVENAFKHVSKDRANWITIRLDLSGSELTFAVANSTAPAVVGERIDYGGIGLKNVRRRLDLLYPNQYVLSIESTQNRFEVALRVHLSTLADPPVLQLAST
ncbi:sensor histidine kinase [Spirosoma koreense]